MNAVYRLLKLYAQLAIKIYCIRVVVNQPSVLEKKGPVLFAANHPNSFLDGIILTTLHKYPVHSLARGDAFKNKWMNKFLRYLQLLPVYRTSEGVENLEHNYTTFSSCIDTFEERGIVLIFSEGRCENEWHLRPLKKGTARLSNASWQKGIPLEVIPLGFNYSSFKKFGKEVHLNFGIPILKEMIDNSSEGKLHLDFNNLLASELKKLVYEIKPGDLEKQEQVFSIKKDPSAILLLIPGLLGILVHLPLFLPVKLFTEARFKKSGHYDSVLTTLLLLLYPVYLILVFFIMYPFTGPLSLLVFIIMPLLAKCSVALKYQFNY
jgi:1-acyl-sn-glycerol-3-phosphate acyltransferase